MFQRLTAFSLILLASVACVNQPRNYEPAGFSSWKEVKPYLKDNLYLANKLSAEEWDAFYKRFPEYFKDQNSAIANYYGAPKYHPPYTAYAFRWTTLNRREAWDATTIARLDRGELQEGDDVFQVIYALGAPRRVVWTNDLEALYYQNQEVRIESNRATALRRIK